MTKASCLCFEEQDKRAFALNFYAPFAIFSQRQSPHAAVQEGSAVSSARLFLVAALGVDDKRAQLTFHPPSRH